MTVLHFDWGMYVLKDFGSLEAAGQQITDINRFSICFYTRLGNPSVGCYITKTYHNAILKTLVKEKE